MISDKGGRGVSHFLIFSDKGGGEVGHILILVNKWGKAGFRKPPFLADIICEQPLIVSSLLCHNINI